MAICYDWAQTGKCLALANTGFCKFLHVDKEEANRMGIKLPGGKGTPAAKAIAMPCVRLHDADLTKGSMGACRPSTLKSETQEEPERYPACATVSHRPNFSLPQRILTYDDDLCHNAQRLTKRTEEHNEGRPKFP